MKKNELVKSMNLTFNKIGFQLQKKSPEILVAAGVVGVVVSAGHFDRHRHCRDGGGGRYGGKGHPQGAQGCGEDRR